MIAEQDIIHHKAADERFDHRRNSTRSTACTNITEATTRGGIYLANIEIISVDGFAEPNILCVFPQDRVLLFIIELSSLMVAVKRVMVSH
jgi:hypothetical protein